jgi:hypothetical protein
MAWAPAEVENGLGTGRIGDVGRGQVRHL